MPRLNKTELDQFLTSGALILKLGTITEQGYPCVNPLWYSYEDGAFFVAGRGKARWVSHIRFNGKVSACIDTPDSPYTRVLIEADAEIIDDKLSLIHI